MRLIDGDILIRKYIDTDIEKFSNSDVKIVLENLKQNILKAPSIDIVRCRECKHWKQAPKTDKGWCDKLDGLLEPTWYCADGERDNDE